MPTSEPRKTPPERPPLQAEPSYTPDPAAAVALMIQEAELFRIQAELQTPSGPANEPSEPAIQDLSPLGR
jgi:hypothetical protein